MHLFVLVLNQQMHKRNVALYSCNKGLLRPHECGAAVARTCINVLHSSPVNMDEITFQ